MKVLITGGAGFIGSHLAARLQDQAEVRVLDDLRTGRRANLEGIRAELIEGSILDRAAVRAAVRGVEWIFHLAAMVSVPESVLHPGQCAEINVGGLRVVLEEAAAAGVRRLCFSSSAAVYGNNPAVPKRESMPLEPASPYAASKAEGEGLCREFTEAGRIQAVSLRYFNVFGPRQNPRSGYASAVPAFIDRALSGQPLTIYGDGEQTRDFVHVRDVAEANLFAASRPAMSGVYNAGYGRSITVLELARRILSLTGSASPLVHAPERPGDVRHSLAAVDALRAAGFRPVSSLEAGLAETVEYFRRQRAGGAGPAG